MKDSCSSVSQLLEKYFDGEVDKRERTLIEKHLEECPACQEALKSLEGLRNLISPPTAESVPEEDSLRLWQNIRREIRLSDKPTWTESLWSWLRIFSPSQKRVWMPAAAAVALLLIFVAPYFFKKAPSFRDSSVVEYVQSDTNNVMVYQTEKEDVTIIWLFEEPDEETSAS
jgi:anti-sigma factor RsiW